MEPKLINMYLCLIKSSSMYFIIFQAIEKRNLLQDSRASTNDLLTARQIHTVPDTDTDLKHVLDDLKPVADWSIPEYRPITAQHTIQSMLGQTHRKQTKLDTSKIKHLGRIIHSNINTGLYAMFTVTDTQNVTRQKWAEYYFHMQE